MRSAQGFAHQARFAVGEAEAAPDGAHQIRRAELAAHNSASRVLETEQMAYLVRHHVGQHNRSRNALVSRRDFDALPKHITEAGHGTVPNDGSKDNGAVLGGSAIHDL